MSGEASIHASAIVDPRAKLGRGVEIGPFCIVGPDVVLGANTRLISHVTLEGHTTIGEDCVLYPQVSMGFPPQDFKHKNRVRVGIEIGDRCTFREMANIHPGTDVGQPITRIGDDCYLMVGAHIAHECQVGNHVLLSNYVQLGGNVTLGDYVIMGGVSAVHQHTRIGHHAFVGGMAMVTSDVIPFGLVSQNPAYLNGLNVVGLKRRGFDRATIHRLRAAYRQLFAYEGTLAERMDATTTLYADEPLVLDIIAFMRSESLRSLCLPDHSRR